MKPTLEEAKVDLANIRVEVNAMRLIVENARYLSSCDDVDANYYRSVAMKTKSDADRGAGLEKHILDLYPELR